MHTIPTCTYCTLIQFGLFLRVHSVHWYSLYYSYVCILFLRVHNVHWYSLDYSYVYILYIDTVYIIPTCTYGTLIQFVLFLRVHSVHWYSLFYSYVYILYIDTVCIIPTCTYCTLIVCVIPTCTYCTLIQFILFLRVHTLHWYNLYYSYVYILYIVRQVWRYRGFNQKP